MTRRQRRVLRARRRWMLAAAVALVTVAACVLAAAAFAKNGVNSEPPVPLDPHFANECPTSIVWDATVGTVPGQAVLVVMDRNNLTRQWVPAPTAGIVSGRFDGLSITGGQHEAVIDLYQGGRIVEHHDVDILGTHECGL